MQNMIPQMIGRFQSLVELEPQMAKYRQAGKTEAYSRILHKPTGQNAYELRPQSLKLLKGPEVIMDATYLWHPDNPDNFTVSNTDVRNDKPTSVVITDMLAREFIEILDGDLVRTVRFLDRMKRDEDERALIRKRCNLLIAKHMSEFPPLPSKTNETSGCGLGDSTHASRTRERIESQISGAF